MSESSNPKDRQAQRRAALHLVPGIGIVQVAAAMKDGLLKNPDRTPYNWRKDPVSLMEYIAAMERHIQALKDGEDFDQNTLIPDTVRHEGAAAASSFIMMDARACGTLIDDRPGKGGAAAEITRLNDAYEKHAKSWSTRTLNEHKEKVFVARLHPAVEMASKAIADEDRTRSVIEAIPEDQRSGVANIYLANKAVAEETKPERVPSGIPLDGHLCAIQHD